MKKCADDIVLEMGILLDNEEGKSENDIRWLLFPPVPCHCESKKC